MKVEELIIDGFKSYATRTVITQWDPQFNAITGLNGSGKSNILDAICFVLGITSMNTVRAQNLQDLIYKRGQAGVTKASVTIVFNNSDRAKSPLGFENNPTISVTRQVVMGGTNKYLINGHRAQQQTVQHLFQSVQLNINNPNFLIMQGRITKVLNMKPVEILALIEEAAGTRMFDDRREKSLKTIEKKEKKVDEIRGLLAEEIDPKLEKLRNEKRGFLEYQQTKSDLERMEKLLYSYDYTTYSNQLARSEDDLKSRNQRLADMERIVEQTTNEISTLTEDINTLKAKRLDKIQRGGKLQGLKDQAKVCSHQTVRLNTLIDLKTNNRDEEIVKLQNIQAEIVKLQEELESRQRSYDTFESRFLAKKNEAAQVSEDLNKKQELLQSLETGLSSKEGQGGGGYTTQLDEAREKANKSRTLIAQSQIRIKNFESLIKQDEVKIEKANIQNKSTTKKLNKMVEEYDAIKLKLEEAGWEPGKLDQLEARESELTDNQYELSNRLEHMRRYVSNFEFNYSKPSAEFDPACVKGVVANLFTLSEDNYDACNALEVCAGNRLYNVIVDTADTSRELINHGRLRRRVTIIPLNQIQPFKISAAKLNAVQEIAPGDAHLALHLIGYEEEVEAAMEYVFGSTIICKDSETAKRVTFNPNIRVKSVTLDGDVYDPSGTLSGGSKPQNSGILVTVQEYNRLSAEMRALKDELQQTQDMIMQEKRVLTKYKSMKKDMDLKEHEVKLLRRQLENSLAANILNQFEERKAEILKLHQLVDDEQQTHQTALREIETVEKDIEEFKANKGNKLQEIQQNINDLKKLRADLNQQVRTIQNDYQTIQVDVEQLNGDIAALKEASSESESNISQLQQDLTESGTELAKLRQEETNVNQLLSQEQDRLMGMNDELEQLELIVKERKQLLTNKSLEIQQYKHDLDTFKKDVHDKQQRVTNLENNYTWILEQKQHFGKPGTPYAFNDDTINIDQCRGQLNILYNRFETLKKKVNAKVMNMIDNVEKKEGSLKGMIKTIEKDKKKIESTITTLNDYKRTALIKTWNKVSEDFGQIFGDLLPGNSAKLVPPEGKDVTEGLEVKVALGKIWKQSLAELSGGQRSLIALSLILALLQFKPAPMYILDEVDAALDLSHTQNIGSLIKTRFKGSQFIVVSLKEGMFNNANRVYRTRFQDGTSAVSIIT